MSFWQQAATALLIGWGLPWWIDQVRRIIKRRRARAAANTESSHPRRSVLGGVRLRLEYGRSNMSAGLKRIKNLTKGDVRHG